MITKKIKKYWIFIILFFIVVFLMFENRNFYSLNNGIYITVWKLPNNICYVIPKKYYGLFPPAKNYFEVTNLASIDVYHSEKLPNILFMTVGESEYIKLVNDPKKRLQMLYLHYENEDKYHKYLVDENNDLKNNVSLISIDISENYLVRKVR